MLRLNTYRFPQIPPACSRLVLFQLKAPISTREFLQRVTGIADSAMAIAKVRKDTPMAGLVMGIVRVGNRELLEHSKLGLNEILPGSRGRGAGRVNVPLSQ